MNAPDVYDQVREYLVNGGEEPTDPAAIRLAEIAPKVWPIMISEVSSIATAQMIQDQGLAKGYREAVNLISDVERVYGRVAEADAKGRRAMLVEILLGTIQKAREQGEHGVVLRATAQIAKMEGLNLDGEDGTNIYQQLILPSPTLSSDPLSVMAQQVEISSIDEQYD